MTVNEKVAHLKGVMEGMDFDVTTKEGKLLDLIVDVLDDICEELDINAEDIETLYDYADELDADLGEVERDLYGDDDDYDCCDCDCEDECDCEDCCDDEECHCCDCTEE